MKYPVGKLAVLLLLSGCLGSVSCVKKINPPSNYKIFSAKGHGCVCQEMPKDFKMEDAQLVGGGAWIQIVEFQEKCIEAGLMEEKDE